MQDNTQREKGNIVKSSRLRTLISEKFTKARSVNNLNAFLFDNNLIKCCIDLENDGMSLSGADRIDLLILLGELIEDNGLLFSFGTHVWAGCMPLKVLGNEIIKRKYLSRLVDGAWISCHAISEPEAGSNIMEMCSTAVPCQGGFRITGKKIFVTNAPLADVVFTYAKTSDQPGLDSISAFIVDKPCSGLYCSEAIQKMGIESALMGELIFDNVFVPAENLLGDVGDGFIVFNESMLWERALIMAPAIGAMKRLLHIGQQYAETRIVSGKAIRHHPLISSRLVDIAIRIETCSALLMRFDDTKLSRAERAALSCMIKITISEAWINSCEDVMAIMGGRGYLKSFNIEKEFRDSIASRFYSGTNEIQKLTITSLLSL